MYKMFIYYKPSDDECMHVLKKQGQTCQMYAQTGSDMSDVTVYDMNLTMTSRLTSGFYIMHPWKVE